MRTKENRRDGKMKTSRDAIMEDTLAGRLRALGTRDVLVDRHVTRGL
jgi:hypothetical protein